MAIKEKSGIKYNKTYEFLLGEIQNGRKFEEIVDACLPLLKKETSKEEVKKLLKAQKKSVCFNWKVMVFSGIIALASSILAVYLSQESDPDNLDGTETEDSWFDSWFSSPCLMDHNEITEEFTRPLYDCDLCKDLKNITRLENISREEFLEKYAYSTIPLVVTGVAREWKALDVFSFHYFKQLYTSYNDSFKIQEDECQFFTYDGQFNALEDVFNMKEEQVNMSTGQWYVGWSNCHPEVRKELRTLYSTPHFLPADSNAADMDWIFMGGQGRGAPIHLDNVQLPSWQAQISGKKTWYLHPAPECEHVCQKLEATINVGDIIIVDTNKWLHATFIHPGNLSITIGTEYD